MPSVLKWSKNPAFLSKKKREQEMKLMIYNLLGFTFPQYYIFSLKHNQQKEEKEQQKTENIYI